MSGRGALPGGPTGGVAKSRGGSAWARDAILAAIRRAAPLKLPLPDVPASWAPMAGAPTAIARAVSEAPAPPEAWSPPNDRVRELVRRFSDMLEQVGGGAIDVPGPAALAAAVAEECGRFRAVVSCVPGLAISTLAIAPDSARERLSQIELAVVPGRFGVAENAAIWVSEEDLPHRALPFIAEHLVLVLPKREIVADMHEAYRRLARPLPGYGVFISGPSKTADIEQALVIGAHGPRSLAVMLV